MENSFIIAGLLAAVLITSGCVSSLDDQVDEELPEDIQEPETEPEPENFDSETESENGETHTEESETEESEASEQNTADRTIEITGGPGNTYNLNEIDVEAGETVEFIYQHEGGQHDLVLEKNGERVEATEILSNTGDTDSFTYTFEEEDNYEFYCSVGSHRAQGMEGQININ